MGQAMFTTYIASQMIQNDYSYWSAFVVALAAGGLLGGLVDLGLMRLTPGFWLRLWSTARAPPAPMAREGVL